MKKRVNPKSFKNLKPYKKGQSGNPQGARLHNPEIRRLKNLTEEELLEVGTFIVKSEIGKLKELIKDPSTSALKAMVAGLAIKTITRGDSSAFDALMNRLLGKVKENLNLMAEVNAGISVQLTMPADGSEKKDE